MSDDVEGLFKLATQHVRGVAGKLTNDKLLYLYARFKQAKEGPCSVPKPGMFNFQEKQKWESWKKLGDMGRKQAMMEYVSYVSSIHPQWQENKSSGRGSSGGLGISVSTMADTDEKIDDEDKTLFDWCKEGNVQKLRHLLADRNSHINGLDEEGLALIHWASDRGCKNVVELLLSLSAQVNIRDSDGQTPLHYAVSCEHVDIISLLVSRGADINIADSDGCTPADIASNDMKSLLQKQNVPT